MRKKIFVIIAALGLMAGFVQVSKAAPMGTSWTYQGRLMDSNDVADGLYDFQFKLFDNSGIIPGGQVGKTLGVNDVDVIEGYFTAELDFGDDAFNGDARWLQIAVRPYKSADPNDYTQLLGRQEVTPAPYSIYAERSGDANNLDGQDASEFASAVHDHDYRYVNVTGDDMLASTSTWVLDVENSGIGGAVDGSTEGGIGVRGTSLSDYGVGVRGNAHGSNGTGVYGYALGDESRGVYGFAGDTTETGYGGYFAAEGSTGRGVYATVSGSSARAVHGVATNTGDVYNYGGYFTSNGRFGRGVYASAVGEHGRAVSGFASGRQGFGGFFQVGGENARAVQGIATNDGDVFNYGGFFAAEGVRGTGVRAIADGDFAVGVYATSKSGTAIFAEATDGGTAGVFQGELLVNGPLTTYHGIVKSPVGPLAYGFIKSDGTVSSATGNVSCTWSAASNRYEITISGESYYYSNYVTTVTVSSGSSPAFATTGSVSGKLLVKIYNFSGTSIQADFQFIIYKP